MAGILETVTQRVGEITIVRDADNIIHSCLLEPKIPERSAEKGQEQVASPGGQPYADDLMDHISIGYSAVDDMLKRIETEPDSDAAALRLYGKSPVQERGMGKDKIVRELEKQTGKISVLVDEGLGHTLYDLPVTGIVIHRRKDRNRRARA